MTAAHHNVELLRFSTAGSVDDGKSTLIGRLLHDSKSIFEDQMEALERSADLTGGGDVNLANLTDGLRAEREQGITIDVAYRYFATPNRKFIISDTPGHIQYTRNMVTGASTANLMLVLVDARNGVSEQTRRHAYISSLLNIPHMVVCVNKMDLVDFSEQRFKEIRDDFSDFASQLDVRDINFIPVSALKGDNVVEKTTNMDWYEGPCLLHFLEEVYISSDRNLKDFRYPVQWVVRPHSDEHHDFRGFAGQIAGGIVNRGDEVMVLPNGTRSRVKQIWTYDGEVEKAFSPMSVTIQLEDELDISRGDLLSATDNLPYVGNEIDANICWMHQEPMALNKKYQIKHNANMTRMMVKELTYKTDIQTLKNDTEAESLQLNEIGRIKIKTMKSLTYDAYKKNRYMGSFVIIDEATNATVGAGMMRSPLKEMPKPEYDDYAI